MKKLKFEIIFASSYDPKWKRGFQQATAIQNRWSARKQQRVLEQEVAQCDTYKIPKKI